MTQKYRQVAEIFASFAWRALLLGYLILVIWMGMMLWPGDVLCHFQQKLFDLTLHECNIVLYGGIGLFKLLLIVCYLIPWLALRWLLHRK